MEMKMTRRMLAGMGVALLFAAIPVTGTAQQLTTVREPDAVVAGSADQKPETPTPVLQQARSQGVGVSTRRRRPSVVGYIDDSTIESKVRIRFDSATGTTVPDRAEFLYAKCGCYRDISHSDPKYDPSAPGPRPGVANGVDYRQLYLEGELAFDTRLSVFGQIPVRWLEPTSFVANAAPSFTNATGISDVRGGIKLGLSDPASPYTLTGKVQLYLPTGDAAKGLGTHHTSVEPSMLFQGELTPTVMLESQVGVWLPIGGAAPLPGTTADHFAGRILYYGIGPSVTIYETNHLKVMPVVELVGWRVLAGNQTTAVGPSDASGTNIVNIKFGARIGYDAGSFYVGVGKALTDAKWYDNILRFEYRYAF